MLMPFKCIQYKLNKYLLSNSGSILLHDMPDTKQKAQWVHQANFT